MLGMKIHSVTKYYDEGAKWWRVRYEDPDGVRPSHYHVFPHEALECRSVEYDTEDVDEILDILLLENYTGEDPGPSLFAAETRAEARRLHHSRCARAKLAGRMSTRGMQSPLEMIRSERDQAREFPKGSRRI
jgi:hypothetical protein